jgi:hypothetical protein
MNEDARPAKAERRAAGKAAVPAPGVRRCRYLYRIDVRAEPKARARMGV